MAYIIVLRAMKVRREYSVKVMLARERSGSM